MRNSHHLQLSQPLVRLGKSLDSCFQALERRFLERVARPFTQACGAVAVLAKVDFLAPQSCPDDSPNPGHPLCADELCSGYCQGLWRLQLNHLRTRRRGSIHRCTFGRSCAVVPLVYRGRCIAAAKLVCSPNIQQPRFRHLVEVLDAMLRDFVAHEADGVVAPMLDSFEAENGSSSSNALPDKIRAFDGHTLIRRAATYIENHLANHDLNVQQVAQALGVNRTYLSHVFAKGVGQRMRLFIRTQRVTRAQLLLATTDWQVKRIAQETGHANANWFSQVFRAIAGVTPNQYRSCNQRSIA